MKLLVLLLAFIQFSALGQGSNIRTLGANPSDISVLSKMNVAIPQSGAAGQIPRSFRMDEECPPVINQCQIGACVSYATAYALCGILAKRQDANQNNLFSPMYMHFFIRACNYDCGKCGANLGGAANFLMNTGVPSYASFKPETCDRTACNQQPTDDPVKYKLTSAKPLFLPGFLYGPSYKQNTIKYYIAQKFPVPIAMDLDQSFLDGSDFNNSNDTWDTFYGTSIGGHSMLIVGYDDERSAFLVMNSWGTDLWNTRHNDPKNDAKAGFCWISYNIIESHCNEAFIANESSSYYNLPVSELYKSNTNVKNVVNGKVVSKTEATSGDIPFFVVNRFNQYGDVRLIPLNIDKEKGDATVAIYKVVDSSPTLYSIFHTKVNETAVFEVDNHTYDFKLLYIRPWRSPKFGIFKAEDALFYDLKIH